MKCWNCDKEIPDDAKACRFCEAEVEKQPTAEEIQTVGEVLHMFDPEVQRALLDVFERAHTAEEFANLIMVGECPKCGSDDTGCCEDDPEIDDILVGRCYACGQLWCTECERLLTPEQPHCDCLDDEDDDDDDDDDYDDEDEQYDEEEDEQ